MMMRDSLSSHDAPGQAQWTLGWWKTVSAWTLACLTMLGMLLAFHAVMRGAVQQAEARQQTLASHAEATWRCKNLSGLRAGGTCLSQLKVLAPGEVTVRNLNQETGVPVE
jgi:hypothetical protein